MAKVKQTLRKFTFAVPTGRTVPQKVRTYIRAADGTDYPNDYEIEIPEYTQEEVGYLCQMDTDQPPDLVTEKWALAKQPPGSIALTCTDEVKHIEV